MDQSIHRLVEELLANRNHSSGLGIRATTIPDGTMKGRLVIEVVTQEGFRILDLPRELRERIYGLTLYTSGKLEISDLRWVSPWSRGTCRLTYRNKVVSGPDFRKKRAHAGQTWIPATAKWNGGPPNPFSLLLVNKQIHAEATPVAYRANQLIFRRLTATAVPNFLRVIGPSVQYLQEISLGNELQPDKCHLSLAQLKDHLRDLQPATGLRTLYLVPDQLVFTWAKQKAKDARDPDSWACAFNRVVSNFLVDLKKAYERSHRSWKAANVIQFVDSGQLGRKERRLLRRFKSTFREIARAYLE